MKFSVVIRYSKDIYTDCKIKYKKHGSRYRVHIEEEAKEFETIEELIKHVEFVFDILSLDYYMVDEVLIFFKCYPDISLVKQTLKDEKTRNMIKNLITFEFRDI